MATIRLSLRQRVWLGFALVIALAGGVVITALRNFQETEQELEKLQKTDQPLLQASTRLQTGLDLALQKYSFFFMDPRPVYLARGGEALKAAHEALQRLQEIAAGDERKRAALERIAASMDRIQDVLLEGVKIAQNRQETYPALRLATEELNPRARQILQLLGGMLLEEEEETAADPDRLDILQHLHDLRYRFVGIIADVRSFLATRSRKVLENVVLYRQEIESDREWLQRNADRLGFEEEEGQQQLETLLPEYFAILDQVIELHSGEKWRMDAWLIHHKVSPLVAKVRTELDGLVESSMGEVKAQTRMLLDHSAQAANIIFWMLGVMLVLGVVVAGDASRQISRLVGCVREGLGHAAEGDLSRRYDERAGGEIGEINALLNQFSGKMTALLGKVQEASQALQGSSDTVSEVSSEARNIIREEHERIEQVATSMNQMVASSQEVAGNAAGAARNSAQVDQQARHGREQAAGVRSGMKELVEQVRESVAAIERLESTSHNIGAVIDVIRGIAEQTNLLALNAAIEAARAGEQGRGFAVVADEVRSLANRTQESTSEIQDIIEKLQHGARSAAEAMMRMEACVGEGEAKVEEMAASLEAIAGAVRGITDQISQIAAAAEEQTAVASDINENVLAIRSLAERASDGAERACEAVASIREVGQDLRARVSVFRLG